MTSRLSKESGDIHTVGTEFSVPPTQVSIIDKDEWMEIDCNQAASTVGPGGQFTIEIPGCESGSLLDLSQSFIQCRGQFESTQETVATGAAGSTHVAPLYRFTDKMFDTMSLTYGGVNVTEQYSNYDIPYFMHQHVARSRTELLASAYLEGGQYDVRNAARYGGQLTSGTGDNPNAGGSERRNYWLAGTANGARPTFSWKHIPLGPWANTRLPSDVAVRLQLRRSPDALLTYGDNKIGQGMTFSFQSVKAFIKKVRLAPDTDRALLQHMAKNTWKILHNRLRFQMQSFAVGATTLSVRSFLQGPRPSKILLYMAEERAVLAGNYGSTFSTPFRGTHVSVASIGNYPTTIRLTVGGKDVPLRGYEAVGGAQSAPLGPNTRQGNADLLAEWEGYRKICDNPQDPALRAEDLSNVRVWGFDCSLVSPDILDPIMEGTQIEATITMSEAIVQRYIVGVQSYTPSLIEIDAGRQVITDM